MKQVKSWIKSSWILLVILAILVAITYFNSLNNAFLSDDIAEIRDNPNIGHLSNIAKSPYAVIRLPLYYITYHIGELNPPLFRLLNILFHLGSVYVVFTLLNLLISKRIAFFVSAIFAVHPAISEGIVWISGGTYPQYTFFFLLSLLFYILAQKMEKKRFYYLSIVFFWFSFMSHHVMALPLFLLFLLYEFSFGNLKKNWLKSLPYLGITLIYLLITVGALPERESTLQNVHYQEKGMDNIFVIIPIALASYFELIFWPKVLSLYHSELAFSGIQFMIRSLAAIAYFGLVVFAFFKSKRIFFWLVIFILTLSPTLTPFRFNWIVAERYLYFAILGILIPAVIFIEKGLKKIKIKNLDLYLFTLIITILVIRTFSRNIDWKSEDNLWIATGKTSPSSPNNHNNLGDVYGRWGDKQKAIQEFQTAITLKPNYADAYHNMANAYRELGQLDKALESYQKATELNPGLWQSYQNIAAIYFAQKQYDKAIETMQKAIQINPRNVNLVNNLGVVYMVSGDKEKAKQIFTQVLTVDPQNLVARQGLIEASK